MRNKIWDIASPLVCLLLSLLCCTMLGTVFFGFLLGMQGAGTEILLEVFSGLSLVITMFCNLLAIFLLRKSYRFDQVRFGFNRRDWKSVQYVAAAFLAASAGHIWSTLIYATGIQNVFTSFEEMSQSVFKEQNPLLLLLATVVVAPVAEELVFRCLIYRRTKAYFGQMTAIILSSLLFGAYHANMIQFIYAAVFGALLALIYEKSGTLLAPILAHAAANLWAVIADALFGEAVFNPNVLLLAVEAVIAVGSAFFLFKRKKK